MKDVQLDITHARVPKKAFTELLASAEKELAQLREAQHTGYEDDRASINLPIDAGMRQWVNQCAQDYANTETLIVIGIGGSNLGTIAVHEAVQGLHHNERHTPKVHFVDTVDQDKTHDILELAEKDLADGKRVVINAISKSGGTTETIANTQVFIDLLTRHERNLAQDIVITTDEGSNLWKLAEERGYMKFAIPKKVGGRYSVLSPVGLFPLAVLGIDIFSLHAGATQMRERCLADPQNNPAAIRAAVIVYHFTKGYPIHNTFVFSTALESLGKWYRQLMGESIGKEWNRQHTKRVHAGITPTISVGSTDLHSMAQLYLGGPNNTTHTFITVEQGYELRIPADARFEQLVNNIQGKDFATIMQAILGGVQEAFDADKRPFMSLQLENKSAHSIGQLLQLNMMEMMFIAALLEVNAFDQPNVEEYKIITKKLLSQQQQSAGKLYLGADHAGYEYKELIKKHLDQRGVTYEDLGAHTPYEDDDYPEYAKKVAQRVTTENGRGILFCGTGTGMVIAANKVPGARAAMAYDEYSATKARSDNDANILALRGREFAFEDIPPLVDAFLDTPYANKEAYNRRIKEIEELEQWSHE